MTELPLPPPPAETEIGFRRNLKDLRINVVAPEDGADARELIRIAQACEGEVSLLLGPLPADAAALTLHLDRLAPSTRSAGRLVWNTAQLANFNEYQFLQPIFGELLARRSLEEPPAWLEAALAHRLRFPLVNYGSRRQAFAFSSLALRSGFLRDASPILEQRIDPASYWAYRVHAELADALLSYTCWDRPAQLKLARVLETSDAAGVGTLVRQLLAQRSREEAPSRQIAACLDAACFDAANPRPAADFLARFQAASGISALGVAEDGRRGLVSRPVEELVESGKELDEPARKAVLGSLVSLAPQCPYELKRDYQGFLAAVEKLGGVADVAPCRAARVRIEEGVRRLQAAVEWLDRLESGLPAELRAPELFEAQQRWQQIRRLRHGDEEAWLDQLEEKSRGRRR
ncbi:MAG: hypothetical protein RL095_1612 [Verrucomicrobiota bacterium]|jgi:hypothetical protein